MINHLIAHIKELLLPYKDKPLLLCCSGGPDSIFLVHMMAKATTQHHHVVYFDHQLRPTETPREIDIVKQIGDKYGYQVHIKSLKIEKKNQANFRQLRISGILNLCHEWLLPAALTGHHLDDDIETLWLQLFKGATSNFRGIPVRTAIKNIHIIHPLLGINKHDILSHLNKNKWFFATDSSNNSVHYTRNQLRLAINKSIQPLFQNNHCVKRTISYLKESESMLINEAKKVLTYSRFGQHWVDKNRLKTKNNGHVLFKIVLEHQFNEIINSNDEKKIKHGLHAAHLTQIQLKHWCVFIDYKWIVISNKPFPSYELSALKCNTTVSTPIGVFTVAEHPKPLISTVDRCCLTHDELLGIRISTIKNCPHPSQKKTYRAHHLSPLEQHIYPVLFQTNAINWVPSIFTNMSTGPIVITHYPSKQLSLFKKRSIR